MGFKKLFEDTIGGPVDDWAKYYLMIATFCRGTGQPSGVERYWLGVAQLYDGEIVADPNESEMFGTLVKLLSDEALMAAMAGTTALIEAHEEQHQVVTARVLRAAHDIASAEYEGRHRKWDA